MKKRIFTLITSVGSLWLTWQIMKIKAQARRIDIFSTEISEKPLSYSGQVHKNSHFFTLTTPAKTYHLYDPYAILDTIAKQQGFTDNNYSFTTCIQAIRSPKGNYGYLGQFDYQLTVTKHSS